MDDGKNNSQKHQIPYHWVVGGPDYDFQDVLRHTGDQDKPAPQQEIVTVISNRVLGFVNHRLNEADALFG